VNNPFVLQLGVLTKIDEQTDFEAGRLEVVVNLSAEHVVQVTDCLNLQDDGTETNEVGDELQVERLPLLGQRQRNLGFKRDASRRQFNQQTLVVDGLDESAAHLVVNLKARSEDFVGFLLEVEGHG
jgi:hypothetical protein